MSLQAKVISHRSLNIFMDPFSLTQTTYELDYKDMVEKPHCPVHVRGMGVDMGLKWAKKKKAGSHRSCPEDSLAEEADQRMFIAECDCACAYPMHSGDTPAAPRLLKVCSSKSFPGRLSLIQYSVAHDL